jgi:hypothetical protein
VVWNPSNGVGLLFLRSAEALAPIAGLPTGISPAGHIANADEWAIDMPVFAEFVDALVDRYQRSTHLIFRSLMEGFIATALVLVQRGAGSIPSLGMSPGPDITDISVTTHGLGERPPGRKADRASSRPRTSDARLT